MSKQKTAFDAQRGTSFKFYPEEVVIIGLDTDDGPEHPRYDSRVHQPLTEAFVRNIDMLGVHTPCLVTKVANRAEVVAGRNRIRAAREANLRRGREGRPRMRVECVIKRGTPQDLFATMVSENEIRVANTPLQRAALVQRMLGFGSSRAQAATAFGVSSTAIDNWGSLLDLPQEIQSRIEAGEISPTAALEVLDMDPEVAVEVVQTAVDSSKKGRATSAAVKRARGARSAPTKAVMRERLAHLSPEGEDPEGHQESAAVAVLRWCIEGGDVPAVLQ